MGLHYIQVRSGQATSNIKSTHAAAGDSSGRENASHTVTVAECGRKRNATIAAEDRWEGMGRGMKHALLSMILRSPPSSSSSSASSSSCEFHRSCSPIFGFLARSTARSAIIRAVESSFCFCSVASRCARTRASSGRYSLVIESIKKALDGDRVGGNGLFVFLTRGFYSFEKLGHAITRQAGHAYRLRK
jgi:hypothetical protein